MRASAYVEAEGHFRRGLELVVNLDGETRQRQEIALLNALGVCIMPTRGSHVRGERASIGKLRRFELAQGLGELLIVEWRDRQQKLVAECASQHCRQLGNLLHFRRRQPIQPGDQRIMKR